MIETSPEALFAEREQRFFAAEERQAARYRWVGWLRLSFFVGSVLGCVVLFYYGRNAAGMGLLLGGYFLFAALIRWHNKIEYARKHQLYLGLINRREQERLRGELSSFASGEEFQEPNHYYAADLDVFGPNSLFQLLNRAVTRLGQQRLAEWLKTPAAAEEILSRQETVAELLPDLEWRQNLEARAMHHHRKTQQLPQPFLLWLRSPNFFQGKAWLVALTFLLPLLTIAAAVYWAEGRSHYPFLGLVLVQFLIAYKYQRQRDEYYEESTGMYETLRSYTDLLVHIEGRSFQSPRAKALQEQLKIDDRQASGHVRQLASIIQFLSARLNTYLNFILNHMFMWDFIWMWRLERWKKTMSGNIGQVLNAAAEFEALASLAAFQYANPTYAVPGVSNRPFEFEARYLSHPLIFSPGRTANSLAFEGTGHTVLITGSNMSGKSTFLRAVGVNMVLAFTGAAVCARNLKVFPALVYTSMRTEDNLAENTSSFYAELKRLKILIDITATGTPVYFFLDEILKGTNSHDRHEGAMALIRQLHQRQAAGFVSTHDLELGNMEQELPGAVENYSFNSYFEDGQLRFDYTLRPGVCQSFNASQLMRQMGIEL
ncbi:DNA mismatch repair protein MutS [Rufibacter glacialis]|uniref:DNA mismatch repair protein MutS n=1 Tax=Rufibacter glacialis TaxID=1259555 RepID=A0A5M8QRR7_9BACT|nr:DNA mismatch repair protein MutS [Rufibacter glacialis]KAA6437356.1 DNA mismatch repair protein MutS [Rufibacter glacialis]GGK59980.1 DNA mismatch repair protein [Rufibacter glacialis]